MALIYLRNTDRLRYVMDSEEIKDLWWLMHHSHDPRRRGIAVSFYADDSGSHDGSTVAVVGGPLFAKKAFFGFPYEWDRCIRSHQVTPPIHMKDFSRPYGRLAGLSDEARQALFSDLVSLINQEKTYSLTASVDGPVFEKAFPSVDYRRLLRPDAFAFLYCLIQNHAMSALKDHRLSPIAYIVADSDVNGQMIEMHSAWRTIEDQEFKPITGSITIDRPTRIAALQAADLVVWSSRRDLLGQPFDSGFEPLRRLLRADGKRPHIHYPVNETNIERMRKVAADGTEHKKIGHLEFTKWIQEAGPSKG